MPLSIPTRHDVNAASALLVAARASIDASLAALEQAGQFIPIGTVEPDPTLPPAKSSRAGTRQPRQPKPPAVPETVTTVPPPETPAPVYSVLERQILSSFPTVGNVHGRALAELVTGSTSVKLHAPVHAALDALVARRALVKAGRSYKLAGPA